MLRRLLFLMLLGLLLVSPVSAREIMNQEHCLVDYGEVIEGSLFALCETLTIHGTVNGDIYGATVRTVIDGTVNGSIYLVATQLGITGEVSEDIHFGGLDLQLNRPLLGELPLDNMHRLSRSIKAISLSTTLYENTRIDDGILTMGYQLITQGNVDSEINFWGSALVIEGNVEGNVYASVGDPSSDSQQIETLLIPLQLDLRLQNPGLVVANDATIGGNLQYWGPTQGQIPTGTVAGTTEYTSSAVILTALDEPESFSLYLDQFGREFSTLLVIGLLALLTMNKVLQSPLGNLRARPFASLAVGMLGFLLSFPIVLIVLLLSLTILGFFYLIGLQAVVVAVGLVLGLVNVAGISVFYFVAIFGARALVGLALGRFILRIGFQRNDIDDKRWLPVLALVIGVGLLALAAALPNIGIVVNALALFLGLGAILNVVIASFRRLRDTAPAPAPVWYAPSPAITRDRSTTAEVPVISTATAAIAQEEQSRPPLPGNQNLPEGFDWSFFED